MISIKTQFHPNFYKKNNYPVRQSRNVVFKPMILPKNEQTNSFLLLCDVFSFVFWKKLKIPKWHFKIIRPFPWKSKNYISELYVFHHKELTKVIIHSSSLCTVQCSVAVFLCWLQPALAAFY